MLFATVRKVFGENGTSGLHDNLSSGIGIEKVVAVVATQKASREVHTATTILATACVNITKLKQGL
jgi:hypothetical protein